MQIIPILRLILKTNLNNLPVTGSPYVKSVGTHQKNANNTNLLLILKAKLSNLPDYRKSL